MTTRSSDLAQITANARNIPDDSVDCGIRSLGWCRGSTCQKYARLRTFIIVLAIAGILQGACETYFRVSAKEAALENDYDSILVDWLLVTSGLAQAVFALVFAHWAHKLHPTSWLGGSIMLQSAPCIITIIPLIWNFSHNNTSVGSNIDSNLCSTSILTSIKEISPQQNRVLVLVLLFILQFVLGLGALAFYTIGIIYIDDNSKSIDSPAAIATALAARIFGLQVGSGLVLGVGAIKIGWWLGWAILGPAIFVSGLLLSLYPKRLPKTVIHQAAQRILEESRSRNFGSQFSTYIDDTDFIPSVKRLFTNKLLMFNLISIMFIQAASFNYMSQEENYLQSRFYLPYNEEDGLMQEWRANFIAYFFKPPVAAVALLVGGLVIAKLQLSARKITGINIVLGIHLLIIYIIFIFLKCNVGSIDGIGKHCCAQTCSQNTFQPVCVGNTTYFSPCYAGCTSKRIINNIEIFKNCGCTDPNEEVISGACNSQNCKKMLIVFQVLSLTAAALLGITAIGKIIISLRCVLPQDKHLALALELTLVGLFAYIPIHFAFDIVSRSTCITWDQYHIKCLLRETPKHGNILNIITASLILIGVFFDILVFIFSKGLNLYNCKVTDHDYTPALYSPIPQNDTPISPSHTLLTPIGGSPSSSTAVQRRHSQPSRPAPTPVVNVFRNPSSVTNSSAGGNSIEPSTNGVTYAQVVFPPDKRKKTDGTDSPKRMAVRADVPLHHLPEQDVRGQLRQLKSFNSTDKESKNSTTDTSIGRAEPLSSKEENGKKPPEETDIGENRPQSPETDF